MIEKNTIIKAFHDWFAKDPHHQNEDFYQNAVTITYLNSISRDQFIDFFFEFARDGGKVQSGGWRTAPKFRENMIAHFDEFKNRILEIFKDNFDLDSWLQWAEGFKNFGQGLASIFLNRVDKYKYVIVNNKSIEGLQKLGYSISKAGFLRKYRSIYEAQKALLAEFPDLDNFYRIDALMHFIIGTNEGKALMGTSNQQEYFNLKGFQLYRSSFGKEYDSNGEATLWYRDTQKKLKDLVSLLKDRLSTDISINYSEHPFARAGRGNPPVLKKYVLTGFSPDGLYPENGELFIKMAFHTLNDDAVFDIEFDQNHNASERPFNEIIDELRETYQKRIPVDEKFPDNWDSLVDEIQDHVSELISKFRELTNEKLDVVADKGKNLLPLNSIIYGPPGTGKTYSTIDMALEILGEAKQTREVQKIKFSEFQKKGRIYFTTFHQNMSYEDFIEGIKPSAPEEDDDFLKYEIEDGLFMQACVEAAYNYIRSNFREDRTVTSLMNFNSLYDKLYDKVTNAGEWKLSTRSHGEVTAYVTAQGNFSVKHRGSQKSYTVSRERLARIYDSYPDPDIIPNVQNTFRQIIGGCNSTAYWSVLNAIAELKQDNQELSTTYIKDNEIELSYSDKKNIVQKFWQKKEYIVIKDGENKCLPFVFIIDEINRGNVAQIFGELITLIEEDKRMGKNEMLFAILPYSKNAFAVPPNLYIIGTMNTADRSIEALDTALRRRFSFIHMIPEEKKLNTIPDGIDLSKMLISMNNRLKVLKDSDHTIGHAWLWDVNDFQGLKAVFAEKILPMLQEFFYNDFEKLGLVLGNSFLKETQVSANIFANFSGGSDLAGQYENSRIYELKKADELTIEDFKSIYS